MLKKYTKDNKMTALKTTVCEDLVRELEAAKKDGKFFEPCTHVDMLDTQSYFLEALTDLCVDARTRASVAREIIRNAAYDGKIVQEYIHMLDVYCASEGIDLKQDV